MLFGRFFQKPLIRVVFYTFANGSLTAPCYVFPFPVCLNIENEVPIKK